MKTVAESGGLLISMSMSLTLVCLVCSCEKNLGSLGLVKTNMRKLVSGKAFTALPLCHLLEGLHELYFGTEEDFELFGQPIKEVITAFATRVSRLCMHLRHRV